MACYHAAGTVTPGHFVKELVTLIAGSLFRLRPISSSMSNHTGPAKLIRQLADKLSVLV